MKKIILGVALAIVACFTMSAQETKDAPEGQQKQEPTTEQIVNRQVERMTKQLSLTEEQQAKVREILTDQVNFEKQARQLERQNKEKAQQRIQSILTDEQKEKAGKMREKGPRGGQHGGGRGGMRPGGPMGGPEGGMRPDFPEGAPEGMTPPEGAPEFDHRGPAPKPCQCCQCTKDNKDDKACACQSDKKDEKKK